MSAILTKPHVQRMLWEAVASNRLADVKKWIAAGADATLSDNDGNTPVILAAERGYIGVMRELVSAGAIGTQMPLTFAAMQGSVGATKLLIAGGDNVDDLDGNGDCALQIASRRGDVEVAATLIAANADLETLNWNCRTPLQVAAMYGKGAMVELLVQKKAHLEASQPEGDTPLILAAQYTDDGVEAVRFLLAAGANVHARNKAGKDARMIASEIGNRAITAELEMWSLRPRTKADQTTEPKPHRRRI